VDVDYAEVLFVNSYFEEVYVVCEDYGLFLDGGFELLLVGQAQFADFFGGECLYAASFQSFDDCYVDAFVSVNFDWFWCYDWSSAFLAFRESLDELFVFSYFFVEVCSVFVVV